VKTIQFAHLQNPVILVKKMVWLLPPYVCRAKTNSGKTDYGIQEKITHRLHLHPFVSPRADLHGV
jgi:hypothetical protein